MTRKPRELDLQSPGYLQLVLNRIMAEHLNQTIDAFTEVGLNIQTTRVLLSLYHHGRLRTGVLAYLVGLEQTAISHLLRDISRRGLIIREREKADNRAVEVRLTAEGKKLATYCHKAALDQERLLLGNLTAAEIAALRKIVWKIDDHVRGGVSRLIQKTANRAAKNGASRKEAAAKRNTQIRRIRAKAARTVPGAAVS
jgi:DNA-binding MarR family transcriptional regulator